MLIIDSGATPTFCPTSGGPGPEPWDGDGNQHPGRLLVGIEVEVRMEPDHRHIENGKCLVGDVEIALAIDNQLGTVKHDQVGDRGSPHEMNRMVRVIAGFDACDRG